jgi:hypothetical protein
MLWWSQWRMYRVRRGFVKIPWILYYTAGECYTPAALTQSVLLFVGRRNRWVFHWWIQLWERHAKN